MTEDPATLLEDLQADVLAVLRETPALAQALILADDAGDIEARVRKGLATLTGGPDGRRGLAVVVLRPEVTAGDRNLPGPPLTLRIEVQCIEQVLYNRDAATGTGLRSSAAALHVLAALQLRSLGTRLLYAERDPVKAVPMSPGFVSEAVTLYSSSHGLLPAKVAAVDVELLETEAVAATAEIGPLLITAAVPGAAGNDLQVEVYNAGIDPATEAEGSDIWIGFSTHRRIRVLRSTGGDIPRVTGTDYLMTAERILGRAVWRRASDPGVSIQWTTDGRWGLYLDEELAYRQEVGSGDPTWSFFGPVPGGPAGVLNLTAYRATWEDVIVQIASSAQVAALISAAAEGDATGEAAGSGDLVPLSGGADAERAVGLSCETPEAAIHYTTDGSFPAPDSAPLYQEPLPLPEAGTTVRAAAFAPGMNPGDVTEFLVTA